MRPKYKRPMEKKYFIRFSSLSREQVPILFPQSQPSTAIDRKGPFFQVGPSGWAKKPTELHSLTRNPEAWKPRRPTR